MKENKAIEWFVDYHIMFFLIFFGILSVVISTNDSTNVEQAIGQSISQNNNHNMSDLDFRVSPPHHNNFEPLHHCTCLDQDILVENKYGNKCKCQDDKQRHCICDACNCHHCSH